MEYPFGNTNPKGQLTMKVIEDLLQGVIASARHDLANAPTEADKQKVRNHAYSVIKLYYAGRPMAGSNSPCPPGYQWDPDIEACVPLGNQT